MMKTKDVYRIGRAQTWADQHKCDDDDDDKSNSIKQNDVNNDRLPWLHAPYECYAKANVLSS